MCLPKGDIDRCVCREWIYRVLRRKTKVELLRFRTKAHGEAGTTMAHIAILNDNNLSTIFWMR